MIRCPRCDRGWPVTRWQRYDGTGSWRMHQCGSVTFDNFESHFCAKNGWLRRHWLLAIFITLYAAVALVFIIALSAPASSREISQWEASDPAVREWYRSLMQPDYPQASCCGEADAYWADEIHVRGGRTFAVITDDRADAPLGRRHLAPGTEIEVPDAKLKWDRGNPTGHNILFVGGSGQVFCFVQGSGI